VLFLLDLTVGEKVYNIRMKTSHIGEVAKRLNLNPRTIRYYETIGLLPPPSRSESGYRLYTQDAVDRLEFTLKSKTLGLTLDEISRLLTLHDKGVVPCEHTKIFIKDKVAEIDQKIAVLTSLRKTLAGALKTKFKKHSTGFCPIIEGVGTKQLTFRLAAKKGR
jgi:DNA-binding transcriptional MerR regulator